MFEITNVSFVMTAAIYQAYWNPGNISQLIATILDGADVLIGSPYGDQLAGFGGNDILIGGAQPDELDGGTGNNTASYQTARAGLFAGIADFAANTGDAEGDTYIGIQNLTGSNFNDKLSGDGSVNILSGLGGNDVMVGKGGGDRFNGGLGSDTASYDASNSGVHADLLAPATNTYEAAGDTYVSIENLYGSTYSDVLLGNNLPNLIAGNMFFALASGNDFLIGRGGNDVLRGNDGNDRLEGDAGIDTLIGGPGNDIFIFNTAPNASTNRDTLDFANVANNNDSFLLENAIFTKLGAGVHALNPAFFRASTHALDTNDYIVYNRAAGLLSYDDDGSGAHAAIAFALLPSKPVLAYNDFTVF
jgi:serralysin